MTVSDRDIEKLKAIGYQVKELDITALDPIDGKRGIVGSTLGVSFNGETVFQPDQWCKSLTEHGAWKKAYLHSAKTVKATMADKVRWLKNVDLWMEVDGRFAISHGPSNRGAFSIKDSPEAAVDALFWAVP